MIARGTTTVFLTGLLFIVALPAMPSPAAADECSSACSAVRTTAVVEGRAALKSCRLGCRGATDLLSCRTTCKAALRQARSAIKSALRECRDSCRPRNACEADCLDPARECLVPVLDQAKTCGAGCKETAVNEGRACRNAEDPWGCLLAVAHELHMCARGCADTAFDSAGACKSGLDACREGCVPSHPCEDTCGTPLRLCLEPIAGQAHQCAEDCWAVSREDGAACLGDTDPVACLARIKEQLGQCALGCRSTAERQAHECRMSFEGCIAECMPPDPCREECYATFRHCIAPLADDGESCARSCAATAFAEGTDCLQEPEPLPCLLEVERRLGVCARGCEQDLRESGEVCWNDLRTCAGLCEAGGSGEIP